MRKTIFGCLMALGFLAFKPIWAETYVSGTITSNTTWALANSPYVATDTVYVAEGVILTIEPGVTVRFATETSLICYGTLNAVGNTGTITFTSSQTIPSAGDWKGVKLSGSGASGSQIKYCDIGYAKQAVYLENALGIVITHNYIHNNKGNDGVTGYHGQPGELGCGIYLSTSTNILVASNTISENIGGQGGAGAEWSLGGQGGIGAGIYLSSSTNIIISSNTISNNIGGTGGTTSGYYGITPPQGGIGCGIYLSLSNGNTIDLNIIFDNTGGNGGNESLFYNQGGAGGQGNIGCGIYFLSSMGNTLTQNKISNSQGGQGGVGDQGSIGDPGQGYGIYIKSDSYNNFIDTTNTYNGESIFYYYGITTPTIIENQNLTLAGSGSTNLGRIVLINCSNFTIRNNTISGGIGESGTTGSGYNISGDPGGIGCGIYLSSSSGNTISNNTFSQNQGGQGGTGGKDGPGGSGGIGCGIYLSSSSGNTISNNTFSQNQGGQGGTGGKDGPGGSGGIGCGIYLSSSSGNIFTQNTISDNIGGKGGNGTMRGLGGQGGMGNGIYLSFSSTNNTIRQNIISNSIGGCGGIPGSRVEGNAGSGQGYGVYIEPDSYNNIIDTSNIYNSEPIYYYYNQSGVTIENQNLTLFGSGSTNLGRIVLINCQNFTVQNNTIFGGIGENGITWYVSGGMGSGIYLLNSLNIIILNNVISNNSGGLGGAGGNLGSGGSGGIGCGIYLYSSTNITILGNTISNNIGGQAGTGGPGGGLPGVGYGIYSISNSSFTTYYNSLFGNKNGDLTKGYGVYHDGSSGTISATFNWWGANSGPEHPVTNPSGQGDKVSDWVEYRPYRPYTLIILSPSSGRVGTEITIEGMDFSTNTHVSIDFGTHLTITTTLSNENGVFSTTFIVDTQPSCTKIITARDEEGNIAAGFFKITGRIVLVFPTSGFGGSIVTLQGVGFSSGEQITIDFGTMPTITTAYSSANGTFSTTFVVNTQPPCTKLITARDSKEIAIAIFLLVPNPKII
ncbi:MAG: right-handed parallel beta-helix repeat-containing protein, partial [bacterium]